MWGGRPVHRSLHIFRKPLDDECFEMRETCFNKDSKRLVR